MLDDPAGYLQKCLKMVKTGWNMLKPQFWAPTGANISRVRGARGSCEYVHACAGTSTQSFMAMENHQLNGWFPCKTSIYQGLPIAMFDCGKVMHTIHVHHVHHLSRHPFLSIRARCPWISPVASPSAQKPLEWWKHLRLGRCTSS